MRTFTFGVMASLGLLAGCQTEQQEAQEAVQDVREAERGAREDVQEAVQEGREDVAAARREMVKELREMERSGEPVEFDAVVVNHDPNNLNLKLESGETFDVAFAPNARIQRGTETVTMTELQPGSIVHVTYRLVDGKRVAEEIMLSEPGTMPAPGTPAPGTPANPDATPGAGGGTR
ncbi:MAG: hypothetical protein Q8P41_00470 [Pseudomonadota bacterium]|nr:hypothetical protein [Pseudomonadota bacterium]